MNSVQGLVDRWRTQVGLESLGCKDEMQDVLSKIDLDQGDEVDLTLSSFATKACRGVNSCVKYNRLERLEVGPCGCQRNLWRTAVADL